MSLGMTKFYRTSCFKAIGGFVREVVWDGLFEGRFTDRDRSLRIFNDHIEAVRGRLPVGRLLVFEVAQGWEPLCEFLEVPVPDTPFPHLNDSKLFAETLHGLTIKPADEPGVLMEVTFDKNGDIDRDRVADARKKLN